MKKNLSLLSLFGLAILLNACASSTNIHLHSRIPAEKAEQTLAVALTQLAHRIDENETVQVEKRNQSIAAAYQTAIMEVTERAYQTVWAQTAMWKADTSSSNATVIPPGLISENNSIPPTILSTPVPIAPSCEMAALVADESFPDWSNLERGQPFTKTWRIKNNGVCTWEDDTALIFASGDAMGGPGVLPLGYPVKPGEEAVLSVDLLAPQQPGKYTGYWKLRNHNGTTFGTGADGKSPIWVSINVETPTLIKMDATQNICAASWTNTAGDLTCPGQSPSPAGWMYEEDAPQVEGGYQDDQPTLVMIPSAGAGGFIRAFYPALQIEEGDHFQSIIGCVEANQACDITFELGQQVGDGKLQTLGSWRQVYDGVFEKISIDLSALAGQMVDLVLTVRSNNGTAIENTGFWLAPVVIR